MPAKFWLSILMKRQRKLGFGNKLNIRGGTNFFSFLSFFASFFAFFFFFGLLLFGWSVCSDCSAKTDCGRVAGYGCVAGCGCGFSSIKDPYLIRTYLSAGMMPKGALLRVSLVTGNDGSLFLISNMIGFKNVRILS